LELDGARKIFEQLGAKPDIERLDALMRRPFGRAAGGLTVATGPGGLSLPAARLGAKVLATDWSRR
jgi:2-polyprenyl-3-methyl-5-hydroxy-6-metoxy-1,4-benzoquinol methylase